MEILVLSWLDYLLFAIMIALNAGIGVYFGIYRKPITTVDYYLGGRKMINFPVIMSMLASTISGITLIGFPAEIYMHGTQFSVSVLSIIVLGFITNYIYLPVFYNLQITSCFEYLVKRFDKSVSLVGSSLFILTNVLIVPVVIYASCLAFNQMTGVSIRWIALIISALCIFYTAIGGFKAVIWADTLQSLFMLCILLFVLIRGIISEGGIKQIWTKSENGGRIEFFNLNPDPTVTNTFWTVFIGNIFIWASIISVSPITVQRLSSVPTLKDSQRVWYIYIICNVITLSICCFSGLILYSKYADCDPFTSGKIEKPDQILSYYILEMNKEIPGISGIFLAGLLSTSLSALSSHLNSLSLTIYMDFIKPFMNNDISEQKERIITKCLTVFAGLIGFSLVLVVENLSSIVQLTFSFCAISSGAMLGVFTTGMIVPFANKKGVLIGALTAFILISIHFIRIQILIWNDELELESKPLRTDGCYEHTNLVTNFTTSTSTTQKDKPFWLFRISYHYVLGTGTMITVLVGIVVSLITRRPDDPPVNPNCVSPFMQKFVKQRNIFKNNCENESELCRQNLLKSSARA